ncbi:hypothetical protein SEA_VIBAKI_51 [Arthrobacter phage Vibaki]|uniref:Uncharacterized protein n=1 Tax=Arthrobacter phage Vibaki TaxID=2593333 RepID=A0A514TZ11_9CAUD|nr:hypothetical protein HYP95_gp51 [Arthrobacter phage Vibaki]QDK01931.1 hypothetical protein SEA_VIBAKI_51 [Arthrobacter phage Vibaki]
MTATMPERPAAAELREIRDTAAMVLDPKNPVPADLHAHQIALAVHGRGYTKAPAIRYPDRDELAFELFHADNGRRNRAENLADWNAPHTKRQYAYHLADVAIDMFRKANQ